MGTDPVRGKILRWTFHDGPVKGKTYEHVFGTDGTVSWAEPGQPAGDDSTAKYQAERVSDDVYVVSYLGQHGYTLTTIVNSTTGKIVSFASNEKSLVAQHGMAEDRGTS